MTGARWVYVPRLGKRSGTNGNRSAIGQQRRACENDGV
jgi:hypothetical protein